MEWILNGDKLETVKRIAKEWTQGIVIIKPFDGDFVFIAVTRMTMFNPADNIHHTTVDGKDVTLIVQQKFDTMNLQGTSPVESYINRIEYEETWELPPTVQYYWYKFRVQR
jgi:hypothetical protein